MSCQGPTTSGVFPKECWFPCARCATSTNATNLRPKRSRCYPKSMLAGIAQHWSKSVKLAQLQSSMTMPHMALTPMFLRGWNSRPMLKRCHIVCPESRGAFWELFVRAKFGGRVGRWRPTAAPSQPSRSASSPVLLLLLLPPLPCSCWCSFPFLSSPLSRLLSMLPFPPSSSFDLSLSLLRLPLLLLLLLSLVRSLFSPSNSVALSLLLLPLPPPPPLPLVPLAFSPVSAAFLSSPCPHHHHQHHTPSPSFSSSCRG